ncbi:MAG: hypothetical protein DHS20C13_26520 [Thermodesulfobacteriota bacterium]|nr:MAG: hypothetical protein DHS20C13_26520 [Thermodesulfobacteriota bacterium]
MKKEENPKIIENIEISYNLSKNTFDSFQHYQTQKSKFIKNYIIDDENEPIDFDPVKNELLKKNQLSLSLIDQKSLSELSKLKK